MKKNSIAKRRLQNSIAKAVILLCVLCFPLSACGKSSPKTLYQSDTVNVISESGKIAVYDIIADKEYNYITKRIRRSEAVSEPYTTVDTSTVKIEIIPSGLCVHDKAKNTVFTVKRKYLFKKG